MSPFYLLVCLRINDVRRSASGVFFFLLLPLVLLGVVGVVFLNGHPFERRGVAVMGLRSDYAPLARFPELRLSYERGTEREAMGLLQSRMVSAVLLPDGGGGSRVLVGPRDELFGRGLAGALSPPGLVEVRPVSHWGYVHYLFPGILTLTSVVSGFFGMGYPMVRYRENLFLKKLSTTPLSKASFVGAQVTARALLTMLQVALLVLVARVAFDLPVTLGAALWLLVLAPLGILVFMGAGFLLACFIKTESAMVDAINVITMPLVFLSEIFFPADELPAPLPALASVLPSTQLVRLLRAVLLRGQTDLGPLLPGLLIIVGWTFATYLLSVLAFRWHDGLRRDPEERRR